MARQYAQVVGIVLLIIGMAGVFLGEQPLLGVVNIDIAEDIVHLLTGAFLVYLGFFQRDAGTTRRLVGGLGFVYGLVGVLGFVTPQLFGLLPHGYSVVDNLIHLAVGVVSIAVARMRHRQVTATA